MTAQEKRLLVIFLVILLGYGVPVELLPRVKAYYAHYQQRIQSLQRDIAFYRQFRKDEWQEHYQQVLQERDEFKARLIQVQDNNPQLLGVTMQGLLKGLARNTGVSVATSEVPELTSTRTQEWTLVTQALEFSANAGSLMHFLHAINNAREYLAVVKLEVRVSGGNMLRGTIKVTGFSNIPPPEKIVETF